MDMYLLIIFGVASFWFGWIAKSVHFMSKLGSDPEHYIEILERIKEINTNEAKEAVRKIKGTELKIERVGEMLYAYALHDNQFIAQGSDLKSVLESAHKRFPGTVFFGDIPNDSSAKELV